MAVSGRKIADFQASLSRGSAEDFAHCCAPCLIESQHVEAYGYCLDCCEYLCKNCHKFHKKTKATRNHQLLDKDNMDKHPIPTQSADVCIEKCSIHTTEVIKFFCPKHEKLGCQDCMIMDHRICDLQYIPTICAGIGDSDYYTKVMKELDKEMQKVDAVLKQASIKDKEIDDSHATVIKDILNLRKEINDHLDTIQKKIEAEASKKRTTSQQEVQTVITSCTNIKSNIEKLKSSLGNSKATGDNGQLFIDIKRAESELMSGEIQQAEISLGKTKTQFVFNRNEILEETLSVGCLGKLTYQHVAVDPPSKTIQTGSATPRKNRIFKSLQHKTNIMLNKTRYITSCVTLSSDKLVLADSLHSTLTVVNPEKNVVTEEKTLDSYPRDIAVLPQDQIAVTMPKIKRIIIMTTADQLSTDYSINIQRQCYGIIYHQNCLYVLCWHPYSVQVLDMNGDIKRTISLADKTFPWDPYYIVLSEDQSQIYVSDYSNHCIASITLQGEVLSVYRHEDINGPMGMLLLDDGSLLVCNQHINSIHHVSADLKQGMNILDGLECPRAICYSADRSEVYIGGKDVDKLLVYSVIYKL